MSLRTHHWQHLLATKEALIAAGGAGRYVYALGYFGHVLYQYDTETNRTARIEVGSVDGHISRNFLVYRRGHVFVPRLAAEPAGARPGPGRRVDVTLVEFGTNLLERRSTSLLPEHYLGSDNPTNAHGIVGLQEMADGSIYFTTHAGYLFRIGPPSADAAGIGQCGHPGGTVADEKHHRCDKNPHRQPPPGHGLANADDREPGLERRVHR